MMAMPAIAANSSPAHRPAFGRCGKYAEAKYVYDAKYMKPINDVNISGPQRLFCHLRHDNVPISMTN